MSWIRDIDHNAAMSALWSSNNNSYSTNSNLSSMAFPWAALATFGGSLLSGIFGGSAQSEANATNLKIARENNAFNANQANINRNWQERMISEQNAFNERMNTLAWNRETAYNSPQAQMARLQAAGINPYVAAGDVANVGNVSTPPATAAPAPSGSVAQSSGLPQINPVNYLGGVPAAAMSFSQALQSLGQAKKLGVDTRLAEQTLNDQIEQIRENVKSTKLANQYKEVENSIYSEYGRTMMSFQMNKVAGEVMLNLAKEDETRWNSKFIEQKIEESVANMDLTKKQKEALEQQMPWLVKKIQQEIKTSEQQGIMYEKQGDAAVMNAQSQRISSLAQAKESYARAQTEDEKRSWVVRNAQFLAKQAEDNWKLFHQTMQEEFQLKYYQVQLIKENIEHMNRTEDLQEKQMYAGIIQSIIGAGSNLAK